MALFDQKKAPPVADVLQLREEGLTDAIIMDELSRKGYSHDQIMQALSRADTGTMPTSAPPMNAAAMLPPRPSPQESPEMGNIYERIEEITEAMIDEKWDDLISEVKKIVDWKEKIEEKQSKMSSDLEKLKEDFQVLHQGVLGKLEDYDTRMQDVGTELKAVGRVFKDVIPTFVQNVKDLSSIKDELKKKK